MKTLWTILVMGLTAALAGCSHQQPKPPARPPATPVAPPIPERSQPEGSPSEPAHSSEKDSIYFAFDAALLADVARPILQKVAAAMKANPRTRMRIEGHCDERGTTEYNLALGESRARAAKRYLVALGIEEARIEIRSYGSERPSDPGHDESAWAKNRRDDLILEP